MEKKYERETYDRNVDLPTSESPKSKMGTSGASGIGSAMLHGGLRGLTRVMADVFVPLHVNVYSRFVERPYKRLLPIIHAFSLPRV